MRARACTWARTPVCIISQCPEPWRSWNTSVAQARFIKNPGYRPAVKIEAAYLLHFVQINLKTCESYSLERLGEEVNNIRLILTSRGGERTKIQKVPRHRSSRRGSPSLDGSCRVHARPSLSLWAPSWPGWHLWAGALPSALGFSVAPWLIPPYFAGVLSPGRCACHPAFQWQLQKLDSIMGFPKIVYKGKLPSTPTSPVPMKLGKSSN